MVTIIYMEQSRTLQHNKPYLSVRRNSKQTTTVSGDGMYSFPGFLNFVSFYVGELTISLFFLLLGYGIKLFGNTFSIDTQGIIQAPNSLYDSWFSLERFGLVLFKQVTGTKYYNNSLASFLMVSGLFVAAVAWSYLFSEGLDNKISYHPGVFVIIFVTSPILAEMLGFLLLGFEISVASVLTVMSLMLVSNSARVTTVRKKIILLILATLLAVVAFSMYLAMTTLFVLATACVFLRRFQVRATSSSERRQRWLFLGVHIAVFVVAYIGYSIANALAIYFANTTTNDYISDQNRWGKDPIQQIFSALGTHSVNLYAGDGIFYTKIFSVMAVIFLCGLLYKAIRGTGTVLSLVIGITIVLSPLMMTVILGAVPSTRTEMTYPLAFAFISMSVLEWLPKMPISRIAVALVCLAIGFNQGGIVNRIFYTEDIVFQQDVLTAQEVKSDIDALGFGETPSLPVVFVNNHVARCNRSCLPQASLGLTGRSMLEIGYSTAHGTGVKNGFIGATLGVTYNMPKSESSYATAEDVAATMPHWPTTGSVKVADNMIIVNF
jgi:hypothetical protein